MGTETETGTAIKVASLSTNNKSTTSIECGCQTGKTALVAEREGATAEEPF